MNLFQPFSSSEEISSMRNIYKLPLFCFCSFGFCEKVGERDACATRVWYTRIFCFIVILRNLVHCISCTSCIFNLEKEFNHLILTNHLV